MADQIFRGQALALEIDMKTDISTGTNQKILYIKPDGTNGEWVPAINGVNLDYDIPNGVLDVIGVWQLQGKIYIGGLKYLSAIVTINVEKTLDD